jgi:predicted transcriptional regulator
MNQKIENSSEKKQQCKGTDLLAVCNLVVKNNSSFIEEIKQAELEIDLFLKRNRK